MFFSSESISIETRLYRSSDRSNKRRKNEAKATDMKMLKLTIVALMRKANIDNHNIWIFFLCVLFFLLFFLFFSFLRCSLALHCRSDENQVSTTKKQLIQARERAQYTYVNLRVDERERTVACRQTKESSYDSVRQLMKVFRRLRASTKRTTRIEKCRIYTPLFFPRRSDVRTDI